jgi:hypothetical protein
MVVAGPLILFDFHDSATSLPIGKADRAEKALLERCWKDI